MLPPPAPASRRGNKIVAHRDGTATIHTKSGHRIRIDRDRLDDVKDYTWHVRREGGRTFAEAYLGLDSEGRQHAILLTKLLFSPAPGTFVIPKNGDWLDCRRENFREMTIAKSQYRSGPRRASRTGYKGVTYDARTGKYIARIYAGGRRYHLGSYDSLYDAVLKYNAYARGLQGEDAYLNPVGDADLESLLRETSTELAMRPRKF